MCVNKHVVLIRTVLQQENNPNAKPVEQETSGMIVDASNNHTVFLYTEPETGSPCSLTISDDSATLMRKGSTPLQLLLNPSEITTGFICTSFGRIPLLVRTLSIHFTRTRDIGQFIVRYALGQKGQPQDEWVLNRLTFTYKQQN